MRKNPWLTLLALIFVFITVFVFLMSSSAISLFGKAPVRITGRNTILHLELQGVIIDGKKFLKALSKYRKNSNVKAIVVEINSPGGVVGPSQEIYAEIKRTREEFKKPVVAVSTGLMASGGYYAAVAADKIIVAPGTLMGSIGVLMEFTSLFKLYDWAKINRFSITTGKYKDSGAEYRPMRPDERALFQNMIDDVLEQFKDAVAEGRKLDRKLVTQVADGRVFTGQQGVHLKLADKVGTVNDAFKQAAELANLGDDYEIFEPPKRRPSVLDILLTGDDDEATAKNKALDKIVDTVLRTELSNRPLYLMPGAW